MVEWVKWMTWMTIHEGMNLNCIGWMGGRKEGRKDGWDGWMRWMEGVEGKIETVKKWQNRKNEKMLKSIFPVGYVARRGLFLYRKTHVPVGYVARRGLFFMRNNIFPKKVIFEINQKKNRLKNGPIRSGIKFCIDPIFVASELIWNRTSYDQNTFYEKIEKNDKKEKWKTWKKN